MLSFKKFCETNRCTAPEVDWNAAWNEVLHLWNERVRHLISNAHAKVKVKVKACQYMILCHMQKLISGIWQGMLPL